MADLWKRPHSDMKKLQVLPSIFYPVVWLSLRGVCEIASITRCRSACRQFNEPLSHHHSMLILHHLQRVSLSRRIWHCAPLSQAMCIGNLATRKLHTIQYGSSLLKFKCFVQVHYLNVNRAVLVLGEMSWSKYGTRLKSSHSWVQSHTLKLIFRAPSTLLTCCLWNLCLEWVQSMLNFKVKRGYNINDALRWEENVLYHVSYK